MLLTVSFWQPGPTSSSRKWMHAYAALPTVSGCRNAVTCVQGPG